MVAGVAGPLGLLSYRRKRLELRAIGDLLVAVAVQWQEFSRSCCFHRFHNVLCAGQLLERSFHWGILHFCNLWTVASFLTAVCALDAQLFLILDFNILFMHSQFSVLFGCWFLICRQIFRSFGYCKWTVEFQLLCKRLGAKYRCFLFNCNCHEQCPVLYWFKIFTVSWSAYFCLC